MPSGTVCRTMYIKKTHLHQSLSFSSHCFLFSHYLFSPTHKCQTPLRLLTHSSLHVCSDIWHLKNQHSSAAKCLRCKESSYQRFKTLVLLREPTVGQFLNTEVDWTGLGFGRRLKSKSAELDESMNCC